MAEKKATPKRNLWQKKNAVTADLALLKNGTMDGYGGGYKFLQEDDILQETKRLFVAHGLSLTVKTTSVSASDTVTSSGKASKMAIVEAEFILTDIDTGEQDLAACVGMGMDTGDKAVSKALAQADKYYCIQNFRIAGDAMDLEGANNIDHQDAAKPKPPADPVTPNPNGVRDNALKKVVAARVTSLGERVTNPKSEMRALYNRACDKFEVGTLGVLDDTEVKMVTDWINEGKFDLPEWLGEPAAIALITDPQIETLRTTLRARIRELGVEPKSDESKFVMIEVGKAFNHVFGVTEILGLPADKYNEALKWFGSVSKAMIVDAQKKYKKRAA